MLVTTSEIVKNRIDGSYRKVFEQHVDHTGTVHCIRYQCPIGFDVNKQLADNAANLNASLIDSESSVFEDLVMNGADPDLLPAKHLNNTQKLTAVTRALFKGEPRMLIKAAEALSNKSDTQLLKFLTPQQLTRLRNRQDHILANQPIYEIDNSEIFDG